MCKVTVERCVFVALILLFLIFPVCVLSPVLYLRNFSFICFLSLASWLYLFSLQSKILLPIFIFSVGLIWWTLILLVCLYHELNFFLFWSVVNSFAGYSSLGWDPQSFSQVLAFKILKFEKSTVIFSGFPVYVIYGLSLAAFSTFFVLYT